MAKKDVTFVTAVYDDLQDTELAGRHNRGTQYAFSLAQMHSMGVPIFCYTDKTNMYKFFPCLYGHGVEHFNFINYNLKDYPLYHRIQEVKSKKSEMYRDMTAWKNRCVEIMWGKFDWIIHTAEQIGLEGDKYLYWIDAGLSHSGVLPKKYNSQFIEDKESATMSKRYNNSFYYDRIFNPDFPDYLANYTGSGKLFYLMCTSPQHSDPSHLQLKKLVLVGTAVGGLFGGNVRMLYDLANEAKELCTELLDNEFLIKEEDILSYLINQHLNDDPSYEDTFNMFRFDTWYHEDWLADWSDKLYDPSRQNTFGDFFEDFVNREK